MSYQVLARKWRPKCFEELMGQEHVVTVLVNALTQQRLHHAYLFTGTRGVGKTTIARIFAKSLNCETGITATPCGQCDTCLEIDQGRFVDLLEIDAASKTKVDDTKEILDNVQYAPTRGRYKVYLIDEVHMLSRHSFNALLKTLEEPPEHVKFILATTDPQKLPVTVLSRCLQFHLKALTVNQIETKLTEILASEQVTHASGTLTLLAKAARGSMRDSLSLADQAIAQGQGNITLLNIQQMLGGIDQNWVYKIVIALLKQDGASLMALSQDIASCAPSYSRLFAELIQLFHQIAIVQVVDQHFDLPPEHAQLLQKFSQSMSAEDVQLYYQICLNGRKDLPYASDEQAAFDMTLLRLFAFKPMQRESLPESIRESAIEPADRATVDLDFNSSMVSESDVENDGNIIDELPTEQEQALAQQVAQIEQQAESIQASEVNQIPYQSFEPLEDVVYQQAPNIAGENDFQPSDALAASDCDDEIVPALQQSPQEIRQTEQEKSKNEAVFESPVNKVLATRNMLRSRKKQLAQQGKKSNDAIVRPDPVTETKRTDTKSETVTEAVTLPKPEQAYQAENIDPAVIHKANQVDEWAHMIDSMELTARLRQLAIHATIDENSSKDNLILCLDQATKHLYTDIAQQQLQQSISGYLSREISVNINIVEQTIADPYQIQSHINDKRYDYAKEVLNNDEIVQGLVDTCQATLDDESISAL
ncbi:DNA polymerase III subunit gamma/tau [Colwellia sp. MSW7]|uniref:DNA polymerase III subunit gamma/tau n=1 Tax=Colwellia maritima TaxID=2912588 RepID=A0ABS9X4F6_9GAMM|nr:DNA polymerase III subunit gamma/tau [Colwellia maritima]MCI2285076.1 DNA polymerase III subunit gamma/tau [Colwellia maritima]